MDVLLVCRIQQSVHTAVPSGSRRRWSLFCSVRCVLLTVVVVVVVCATTTSTAARSQQSACVDPPTSQRVLGLFNVHKK